MSSNEEYSSGEEDAQMPEAPTTSYRTIAPLPNASTSNTASPSPVADQDTSMASVTSKNATSANEYAEASSPSMSRSTSFTTASASRASANAFTPRSPQAQAAAQAQLASQQQQQASSSRSRHALPAKPDAETVSGTQKRSRVEPSLNPALPKVPKTTVEKENTPRLIVVLEQACLETYKLSSGSATAGPSMNGWGSGSGTMGGAGGSGGGRRKNKEGGDKYALLNCDDHQRVLAKMGRDIAEARPDITHQCLLTLLDSPLNKSGFLQVYIHTAKGVLIEVNPHVRIPRTFKRFSGLMVQLLHKLSIRSVQGSEKLLKVIRNPVTDHFPSNTHKITLSHNAPVQRLSTYLPTVPKDHSIAVFVGAMAHGADTFADGIVDEKISISEYSLSASVACGKFCCGLEEFWGVV
ncbi:Nep1-domain-containing protein [Tilletiaria anomala UBC 951]|uniref:Nep1-domain-containing protein n=1 Tax=Tilletiaria anomala (strain ATCC 24038 / CBS 436.72 / UBC 951) TaxID=1037660 RepID=A0A066W3A8_TILAU|nr:Nep1-domain-containing protein [Tilletiaria anomala UBC 951]KDN48211.1 Nep1-domain-containing protein [Tilletiaria anomala UBC 951]